MINLKNKAVEFNKYFESGNGVDVNEFVRVSRDEWRELYSLILECSEQCNSNSISGE